MGALDTFLAKLPDAFDWSTMIDPDENKRYDKPTIHKYFPHQQKLREMAQEIHNERVAADLVELDRLRRYLIFKSESRGPRDALLSAIDDYVEGVTGDRSKLHDHGHSNIG